jgi:hypothetical protein
MKTLTTFYLFYLFVISTTSHHPLDALVFMTRIQSVSILGWFGQPIPRHLNQVTNHNFTTTTTVGTPSVEGGGTAFTGIASKHGKQAWQASIASKHRKQKRK